MAPYYSQPFFLNIHTLHLSFNPPVWKKWDRFTTIKTGSHTAKSHSLCWDWSRVSADRSNTHRANMGLKLIWCRSEKLQFWRMTHIQMLFKQHSCHAVRCSVHDCADLLCKVCAKAYFPQMAYLRLAGTFCWPGNPWMTDVTMNTNSYFMIAEATQTRLSLTDTHTGSMHFHHRGSKTP